MIVAKGFEGAEISCFSEEGVPDQALGAILKYFAYKAGKRCTAQAEYACDQFQDIGIRAACYAAKGLVKFKKPIVVTPTPEPPALEAVNQKPSKLAKVPTEQGLDGVNLSGMDTATISPVDSAKQVSALVLELLSDLELGRTPQQDKSLKVGVAISAAQIYCPEIADALKPAQKLLAGTTTTDGVYLTPTALGERLGMSAIKVNKVLIELRLQAKVDSPAKGEPKYLPTPAGKPYSMMTITTGQRGDTTSYQHLKWSERVLKLFNYAKD